MVSKLSLAEAVSLAVFQLDLLIDQLFDGLVEHFLILGRHELLQDQFAQIAQEAGRVPSSVLSVVRNPSWLTPYIGCAIVGAGLLVQFLTHLVGFISKTKTK